MSNLKVASCAYSKNQILHMQIKSFETVVKFTKAKLTRNRRQSRSASGNREALEEAENQYHFNMRHAVAAVAQPDGI